MRRHAGGRAERQALLPRRAAPDPAAGAGCRLADEPGAGENLAEAAHGVRPRRVEQLPLGVPIEESTADAVLLIGDRAMVARPEGFAGVVDLSEAWNQLTGLPFVFALWVARPGVDLGNLPDALARSRDQGLTHARDLAAENGPRLGLDVATCYDYLTSVLSYDLGEPELAGLRRFAEMAARLGLAPEGASLVFHRRRDLATQR